MTEGLTVAWYRQPLSLPSGRQLPLHRGALIQGSLAKAPFVKFHKFGVAHSSTVCYTVLSDYSGDGR